MSSLHKDDAAFLTERFVQAHVRTSDPRSSGIATVLIFKNAINNKNLFSSIVPVGVEKSLGCPPNQG
jgi:hypothetical protein